MAKVLKDPIAPKVKTDGTYPWSFSAPTKDFAHSGCLSAGNYYGVGFRTPVGKEKAGDMSSGPIPQKSERFSAHEIFYSEDKKG